VDVKNGANLLDRLVKDIVTESDSFDVETFIPLLQKHIKRTNPYVRQLIVGWITVLDSVPDIQMLDWIPEILDGLFNMLSDGNKDIRQAADLALADFLKEIKMSTSVEFLPMVSIVVSQSKSKDRFSRLTAMTWILEFIALGGEGLGMSYSDLLGSVMWTISDQEPEIRVVAERTNETFRELVRGTSQEIELIPLLHTLIRELLSEHISTRIASLGWIYMLLEKFPAEIMESIDDLLPVLLKTLNDESDEVVLFNLQVMARISIDEVQFDRVLQAILQLFSSDRRLLEARGSVIIRKLSILLNPQRVYLQCASILGFYFFSFL